MEKVIKLDAQKQRTKFMFTVSNPQQYQITLDSLQQILQNELNGVTYYCLSYELAPSTGMPHIHGFFLCKKTRWSTIQRKLPHAHIESEVRGTIQQARDYVAKEAENIDDEKKKSLVQFVEWGVFPKTAEFDKENLLEEAEKMIDAGLTPNEIFEKSILFRHYESQIRRHYFAKRYAETPPIREVKVIWHCGASSTGKSYSYVNLCKERGADHVFITCDYANRGTATFDGYNAEEVVFLDELKKDSLPFHMLLVICDHYRIQLHCRYSNAYALYNEVHISSIYPPEEIYAGAVDTENRSRDAIQQLLRRITKFVYHYKDDTGNFCSFEMDGKDYFNYDQLIAKAKKQMDDDGFVPVDSKIEKLPFD